jgi:hypothetical protein
MKVDYTCAMPTHNFLQRRAFGQACHWERSDVHAQLIYCKLAFVKELYAEVTASMAKDS